MLQRFSVLLLCTSLTGCASSLRDRAWLEDELRARTGAGMRGESDGDLPPSVSLDDGLDEAEVVSIALWRSPLLRAELTRIDAAFATLHEARRPMNPQLSIMGPIGPVTAVATLFAPLESLWQIPRRTEAAAREADAVGESVLMRALDLVRDARLLHIELGLAADRASLRTELAAIAVEVARIATVRAEVGEINPMEERVLSAEARASTNASDSAETEVRVARARLAATLAIDRLQGEGLRATFGADVAIPVALPGLIEVARAARPDARSAELAVSAATARAGWERRRVVNVGALIETQWSQPAGPSLRLGARLDLPIFNANVGGIGRSDAEVERAVAQHEVVARAIIMEVTIANDQLAQATRSRQLFEAEVTPALEAALETARESFESGDENYLVVLDVLRRAGEARIRRAELMADQRRALCELERAIGARLQHADGPATLGSEVRGTP